MDRMSRPTFRGRPHFRGVAEVWLGRARQWCIQRTRRDARLAAARGRPISESNQRRLRARRWADLAEGSSPELYGDV